MAPGKENKGEGRREGPGLSSRLMLVPLESPPSLPVPPAVHLLYALENWNGEQLIGGMGGEGREMGKHQGRKGHVGDGAGMKGKVQRQILKMLY